MVQLCILISARSTRVYTARCDQSFISDRRAIFFAVHQHPADSLPCVAIHEQAFDDRIRPLRSYEHNECLRLVHVPQRRMD